jgi:hypothetical protein
MKIHRAYSSSVAHYHEAGGKSTIRAFPLGLMARLTPGHDGLSGARLPFDDRLQGNVILSGIAAQIGIEAKALDRQLIIRPLFGIELLPDAADLDVVAARTRSSIA